MKIEKITNKFNIEQTLINMSIEEMKSNETVDKTNFHDCTVANWNEVENINFVADYKSGSGSEYMYTENGVYRKSNHWSVQINTCIWLLDNVDSDKDTIAFCSFKDFKKYSSKRNQKGILTNDYKPLQNNIQDMLIGKMVLKHRIGNIL